MEMLRYPHGVRLKIDVLMIEAGTLPHRGETEIDVSPEDKTR
jgi:hypothetical protein